MPVQTSEGRWYVLVELKSDKGGGRSPRRSAAAGEARHTAYIHYRHSVPPLAIYATHREPIERGPRDRVREPFRTRPAQ